MYCGSRAQWKKEPGYYFHNKPKTKFIALALSVLKFMFSNNAERVFNFMLKLPFRWMRAQNHKLTYFVSDNAWWLAHKQNPWIEQWCKQNPNVVIYGEIFGPNVQGKNFHYGMKEGEIGFRVFDILDCSMCNKFTWDENGMWYLHTGPGKWINNKEFWDPTVIKYSWLKFVPLLYIGPYDLVKIQELAEMKEDFNNANHVREGVVIKPVEDRVDPRCGRVALKYVSNQYLLKS